MTNVRKMALREIADDAIALATCGAISETEMERVNRHLDTCMSLENGLRDNDDRRHMLLVAIGIQFGNDLYRAEVAGLDQSEGFKKRLEQLERRRKRVNDFGRQTAEDRFCFAYERHIDELLNRFE